MKSSLFSSLAVLLLAVSLAGMAAPAVNPELRVTNLVAEFLTFHEAAEGVERDMREEAEAEGEPFDSNLFEERLKELWHEHLGGMGTLLARDRARLWEAQNLADAWDRYGDRLDRIRRAGDGVSPNPAGVLRQVSQLLELDRPLQVHMVLYVGTFQDDPAFRLRDGEYSVLLPVEQLPQNLRPVLMDLYTRAIHARMSGRPADDGLSLAQHLFLRGLALRVQEEADPGRWAHEYLLRSQDWLLTAEQRDGAILNGVRSRLNERNPERLAAYLDGGGATGLRGEFDYAAWRVSGMLLMNGWTLDRLARVPEGEVGALVAETLRDS